MIRRTSTLPDHHRVEVDGIPAASVARTIVDLAPVVDDERLLRILVDAWRRGLVTPLEVNHRVEVAGRRFEIDLAWPHIQRGIEIDGEIYLDANQVEEASAPTSKSPADLLGEGPSCGTPDEVGTWP